MGLWPWGVRGWRKGGTVGESKDRGRRTAGRLAHNTPLGPEVSVGVSVEPASSFRPALASHPSSSRSRSAASAASVRPRRRQTPRARRPSRALRHPAAPTSASREHRWPGRRGVVVSPRHDSPPLTFSPPMHANSAARSRVGSPRRRRPWLRAPAATTRAAGIALSGRWRCLQLIHAVFLLRQHRHLRPASSASETWICRHGTVRLRAARCAPSRLSRLPPASFRSGGLAVFGAAPAASALAQPIPAVEPERRC